MFNNLFELMTKMPDEATCKKYLAEQRWEGGKAICPYCGHGKCYNIEGGKRYKCGSSSCYKKFSVTVGTIFEASNIPLNKWFMALFITTGHKKGISSYQLARDIGVSQKAAWFMLHRIRELMKPKDNVMLDTIVEVDETWTGGKMKNKHVSVRKKAHEDNVSHIDNKTGVMGFLQREGTLKLNVMDADKTLKQQVKDNVKPEALVITDGLNAYTGLADTYEGHEVVNHKKEEYVRGEFHTNSIEGAFGLFKRMVFGIYHQISPKHSQRYCDEFTYRYNSRMIKDAERFTLSLRKAEGRLDYKTLVGRN
jgi:transposase-like protein